MAVAQEALHFVFKLHAGFLQSYEMDERKRMLWSYRIVRETAGDIEDSHYPIWQSDTRPMSEEAMDAVEARVLHLIQESIGVLLRIASNYVAIPMRQIPNNLDAAEATLAAYSEELDIRMANTQQDRIRQAIGMIDEFYASWVYDNASHSRFCYDTMCKLQGRIDHILRDIDWVGAETDEHVSEWIHETRLRLRRMDM
jgi:hypothetical protein